MVIVEGPRFFQDSHYLSRVRADVASEVSERYRSYARQQLAEMALPIIPQPSFTITAEGMTDMRYNHENPADQHHASTEFGRLMIEEICRFADGS